MTHRLKQEIKSSSRSWRRNWWLHSWVWMCLRNWIELRCHRLCSVINRLEIQSRNRKNGGRSLAVHFFYFLACQQTASHFTLAPITTFKKKNHFIYILYNMFTEGILGWKCRAGAGRVCTARWSFSSTKVVMEGIESQALLLNSIMPLGETVSGSGIPAVCNLLLFSLVAQPQSKTNSFWAEQHKVSTHHVY